MDVIRRYTSLQPIMGRFAHGDDLIEALQHFCQTEAIEAAWVTVIGAVSRATLSYYDQTTHQYKNRVYEGHYEIIHCTGNISLKGGEQPDGRHPVSPMAHLHMVLSDENYQTIAGHVIPGGARVFAGEFLISALMNPQGRPLRRGKADPQTGLPLWPADGPPASAR
ncbi:MAG: PPC domain-containing DNA-binding protein [Candidatus Melainabacteria bacterium]